MIGRTLAHYEILDEISRGGMGVVYRARDVNLGREVALKVLPEELTHDAERRERLLQEARSASALEHSHIAVIHGVGEVEGVTFIAMELIRGEKLSETLARGALPHKRALDLAAEVAEGLARAHSKSIVHRDLKPANVMVTEDGHAKIIDFGLAKLVEPVEAEGETATVHTPRTEPGLIMGTASYMSPEQARGGQVDHRSDVFSFGVMLYEMLAGPASPARSLSRTAVLAVGATAIAAVALFVWRPWADSAASLAPDGKPAVAVLYFENQTGDESLDWMRTGLTDMMVTDLSQDATIEVLGTDRLYQILDELNRADNRVISADVVQQIADRAASAATTCWRRSTRPAATPHAPASSIPAFSTSGATAT